MNRRIIAVLLALTVIAASGWTLSVPAPRSAAPALQEPEDPSRVLNLLDGLVERIQESSPLLAGIVRFLGFLVWLFLHLKVWGPSLLATALLVGGVLVWQRRRQQKARARAKDLAEGRANNEDEPPLRVPSSSPPDPGSSF